MKKFILACLFLTALISSSFAQSYKYYSTEFAYKVKNDYGTWSEWSDWVSSHCLITINLDRNVINIYSDEPQEYDIYDYDDSFIDDRDGGQSLTLKCVDRDALRCQIRLRVQTNSQLQLYVDYNDVMFVYNIILKE